MPVGFGTAPSTLSRGGFSSSSNQSSRLPSFHVLFFIERHSSSSFHTYSSTLCESKRMKEARLLRIWWISKPTVGLTQGCTTKCFRHGRACSRHVLKLVSQCHSFTRHGTLDFCHTLQGAFYCFTNCLICLSLSLSLRSLIEPLSQRAHSREKV